MANKIVFQEISVSAVLSNLSSLDTPKATSLSLDGLIAHIKCA